MNNNGRVSRRQLPKEQAAMQGPQLEPGQGQVNSLKRVLLLGII